MILPQNNMEHLLEADDDISNWEADQLMLEIDDALNDNTLRDNTDIVDLIDADAVHHSHRVEKSQDPVGQIESLNLSTSSLNTDDMGFPLSLFSKV